MAPDAGVDKFVQDDIVGKVRRHDGQERIEPDAAGAGGPAPDSPLAADAQAAGAVAVFAGQSVQALGEIRPGGAAVQTLSRQDRLTAAVAGPPGLHEQHGAGAPPRSRSSVIRPHPLQKHDAIQSEHRPDHVVARQSSLRSLRLKQAMLHYEIGVRIGELSPPAGFDGVLPSRTNSESHAGLCPRSDVAQKDAERTKTSR